MQTLSKIIVIAVYYSGLSVEIYYVEGFYIPFANPSIGYRIQQTSISTSEYDSSE